MKSRNMGNHSSGQLNTGCIFYRVPEPFFVLWLPITATVLSDAIKETACFSHLKFRGRFCSLTDDSFWCEHCRCSCQVTATRKNNSASVFVSHFHTDRCASSLKFYIHCRRASVLNFKLTAPKIITGRLQIERAKALNCYAVPVFTSSLWQTTLTPESWNVMWQ